jgi:tetratricopeptide (TPR) repeat protein
VALTYIALIGWIPVAVVMFALLPIRRAAATAVIGAWLLLPPFSISISSFPDYSRITAASVGLIFGTLFFGLNNIISFRPRWFDVPMLLWCLAGSAASLSNGLGPYDALSACLDAIFTWGLPYFFGRIYFSDRDGLRTFTVAMVIAGLVYVLPCVWEIRMSPQLLGQVYGASRWQGERMGGYRPNVFFSTGLELGLWMTAVSLTAWWFWRCGVIKKFGPISFGKVMLPILLIVTFFCRSTGAVILLIGGTFLLWASTRFRTRMLLWALLLLGPFYVALRVPNVWSGEQLVNLAEMSVGQARAISLEYRFKCENLLIAQAIKQPLLGWGGWGRSAAFFSDEGAEVPTDGLWVITLGTKGFVGLTLFYLAMELPVLLFLWRFPVRIWHYPQVAPAALAATLLSLYMIDCLLNGFVNIIYVSLAGGLIGITPAQLGAWRGSTGAANQASHLLQRKTAGIGPRPHAITGEQPDHLLPHHVLSQMAVVDRYRRIGRSLKSQRRWADAHSAWQQALDILTELTRRHSDISDLQQRWCDCGNDLAWLLLNHPDSDSRGPAYALTLATQVVQKCSEHEVYWNTLGAAYLRNGDAAAAVAALNRAMASAGEDNPFNHVFLAMAYARLGDREQAQHWLAQAILVKEQDYPDHPELTCFCDEACAVVGTSPGAAPAVI